MSNDELKNKIMTELSTVIEPELHKDLVTLNMIRDLEVEGNKASLTVMLTTPACPLKDQISHETRTAVLRVPEIKEVTVNFDSSVPTSPRSMGQLAAGIKNMIAVSSGKGGVGKSTIAANLAIALAQSGASVGLMDADILGPNLHIMMGIEKMPAASGEKLAPAESYGVKLMSMGFLVKPDQPLIWRGPMLHGAIRQFFTDVEWGELDYLVIDLPPGTSDAQLTLAQSVPLTGAVIVTQPMQVAVSDALRGLAMFEQVNVPIIGVVENMTGEYFGEGGGKALAEARNVLFLGSVPLDNTVRIGGDSGKPVVATNPEAPAAQALQQIAQEIAARVSVLAFQQGDNVIPLTTIG